LVKTSNNPQSLNHLTAYTTDNANLQMILFQIWLSKDRQDESGRRRIGQKGRNLWFHSISHSSRYDVIAPANSVWFSV